MPEVSLIGCTIEVSTTLETRVNGQQEVIEQGTQLVIKSGPVKVRGDEVYRAKYVGKNWFIEIKRSHFFVVKSEDN